MREIIAEQLNCDGETIGLDTSFKDDLGADSLDLFELVMALEEEYGLAVSDDERGYLASYFGVFLAESDLKQKKPFRIALVCGTGRVTARLVAVQLKRILDSSTELEFVADERSTAEL